MKDCRLFYINGEWVSPTTARDFIVINPPMKSPSRQYRSAAQPMWIGRGGCQEGLRVILGDKLQKSVWHFSSRSLRFTSQRSTRWPRLFLRKWGSHHPIKGGAGLRSGCRIS